MGMEDLLKHLAGVAGSSRIGTATGGRMDLKPCGTNPQESQSRAHAFGQRTGRVRDPLGNIGRCAACPNRAMPADPRAQETLDRERSGPEQLDASRPLTG
jgi:hypothetical protein